MREDVDGWAARVGVLSRFSERDGQSRRAITNLGARTNPAIISSRSRVIHGRSLFSEDRVRHGSDYKDEAPAETTDATDPNQVTRQQWTALHFFLSVLAIPSCRPRPSNHFSLVSG